MSVISIARGDKDELAINSGPFDLIMTKWFTLSFGFVFSFARRTFKLGKVENFMPFNSVNKSLLFTSTLNLFFSFENTWHRTTA